MVGFTSLFRIPTSEPSLPHLVREEEAPPRSATLPVIEAQEMQSGTDTLAVLDALPVIDTEPVIDDQWIQSQTGTLPVIDTVPDIHAFHPRRTEVRSPAVHPKQLTGFGNKKLYRCVLAQDGHSHGEEALYQILWKAGKPEAEETRTIAMGYGEMSKRIRLLFNNTKAMCLRLIQKLAIEEIAHEVSYERIGKTYRIFSYKVILERRRANNMEWVIKNKGVEFVMPSVISIPELLYRARYPIYL
jgi:hypothetical protein